MQSATCRASLRCLADIHALRIRTFSSVQQFTTPHGAIKISLDSSKLIGVQVSRGERPYQQDACAVHSLDLPTRELRKNLKESSNPDAAGWRPARPGAPEPKMQQVVYLGVFDGHGTEQVSEYLKAHLHELFETVQPEDARPTIDKYRGLGGNFFRRFKGGILDKIASGDESEIARFGFALDQRATLAFLQADQTICHDPQIDRSGATATVALMHSLDVPPMPFFASSLLAITIAHVGDTSALLCTTADGSVLRLTEDHHPDSRNESNRLQRVGIGLVTDSFGESRLGGALANSRAIGDKQFKRLGVTGEPDITKVVLKNTDYAFLVLLSDGITSMMSDQEIIDLVRGNATPAQAAKAIVGFAEMLGGEDNMTCIVAPLSGWNKVGGTDQTKERRQFRLDRASTNSRQRRM